LSWLRELVAIDVPLAELRRRLTMAGVEVEDVYEVGLDWREVTIGRITSLQVHPRRELLNVAELDLGDRTTTVVTGAQNLRVGDIVPHVATGGQIPVGTVGRRDFAGIASEGMVLSGDELDISPDKDGIYVFETEAPVGKPVADFLSEVVLDIYITPNRPDCMSMMGIAREVHALFDAPYTAAMEHLLDPAAARVKGSPGGLPVGELVRVQIEDPVGCPRFSASVVQGISIAPSPKRLQRRLYFAGVRPISNVVDVTNYVMLEVGQPLHAFDRDRLGSDTILVRRARPRERLKTLDGEDRELTDEMMVVTDGHRARSLAGIMGGEDSEIADSTRDVVLEGASWDRASIRRTSAALGLSSEASRRFGRGVDPDLTALGVARATALTMELAGGNVADGLADEYPGRETLRTVELRPRQVGDLLGMEFSTSQIVDTLSALGFSLDPDSAAEVDRLGAVRVAVPGWRRFDVEGRADLAEEVGRIAGFDLVPSTMPTGALPAPRPDGDGGYADESRARRLLASAGLHEVITYSLVDPDQAAQLSVEPLMDGAAPLRISNPQSVEQSVLRSTLLGSVLHALRSNLKQRERVLLYELARTWHGALDPLPDERRSIGIAIVGPRQARGWSTDGEQLDFYDLKGIVDALAASFHVSLLYAPVRHRSLHPGRAAAVSSGDRPIGVIGQLHPTIAERFDLGPTGGGAPPPVFVAELDFENLLRVRQPLLSVQTPSRFPPSDRDVSFYIDETTPNGDLEAAIRRAAGSLLEDVLLFDLYTGQTNPAGRKSLAYALRYRAPDRTLGDEEVSTVHGRVEAALQNQFCAEVRGR
jgi:phenylalanyl-tRNA synthetase beta chain